MKDPRLLFLIMLNQILRKARKAGDWETCNLIEPQLAAMYKDLGERPHRADRNDSIAILVGFEEIESEEIQEMKSPTSLHHHLKAQNITVH